MGKDSKSSGGVSPNSGGDSHDNDPILRVASSTEHPAVSTAPVNKEDHSTLLGYFWNVREDSISTNKSS